MNSLSFRICTALLTFLIGVSVATAWVYNSHEPFIEPVPLGSNEAALEMVFVLDTTGSMGGLLEGAKQRIWGIVNEVMQSSSKPSVKVGLVAYRDRGDAYVSQVLPLTSNLDKVYETLMDYEASGGGDGPENVRRALADGLEKAGWSPSSPRLAQIIFLVGDAPPHDDYDDEVDTRITAANAVAQGKIVNTIQCGNSPDTTTVWQSIAQRGQGQYFAIAQNGGVQTIETPYDEQLSQLAGTLGRTFVAYGGGAGEAGERRRADSFAEVSRIEERVARGAPQAKADRALNKVVNEKAYDGDLLQNIENGSLKLDSVKDEDLPTDLRKLSPEERKREVDKRLAERRDLRARIVALSKQRMDFIAAEQAKRSGGQQNSFDVAVSKALKEQLARKGLN